MNMCFVLFFRLNIVIQTLATGQYMDYGMCFELDMHTSEIYSVYKSCTVNLCSPGQIKGLTAIHHGISTVLK